MWWTGSFKPSSGRHSKLSDGLFEPFVISIIPTGHIVVDRAGVSNRLGRQSKLSDGLFEPFVIIIIIPTGHSGGPGVSNRLVDDNRTFLTDFSNHLL